jgi:hypothetical protein
VIQFLQDFLVLVQVLGLMVMLDHIDFQLLQMMDVYHYQHPIHQVYHLIHQHHHLHHHQQQYIQLVLLEE